MIMKERKYLPALVVAMTLAVGILIGTLVSNGVRAARPFGRAPDARPLPPPSPAELSSSFARIADQLEPAVVNINTESTVRVSQRRFRKGPEDEPFDDLFDRLFRFGPDGPSNDFRQQSLGSGVILDRNGYVLTNYHVIMRESEDRPVDRIRVFLHGETSSKGYMAKVVGSDRSTDLAVIRIEAGKPLAVAQFGDSESMRVGDWVLAIGSPFGLENTVTAGIISAKDRRDIERQGAEGQFKRFIQTDAAINPGNSGGPLVNLAGQVVGINTAIATRKGTSDGVGFAIPSNNARKIYNAIISNGSVRRGAIGVSFRNDNTAVKLRSFGTDHGVVVEQVQEGSPASRAGLRLGDVIIAVDGKPIANGDDLVAQISDMPIGKRLKVEFLRDQKRMSAEVEVGDRSAIVSENRGAPGDAPEKDSGEKASAGILGFSVKNLNRDQTQKLSEKLHLGSTQGVLISDIKPDGFASDLGVQPYDVLLSINHQPVNSVDDFNRLQAKLKSGSDVLLLVARPSEGTFTTLFLADTLP
jgi:serine protease Do